MPTCADEQHCIGGSIKAHDTVSHQVGEVGVLLHEQGPAPARPHLFLHQWVLLDEVEGIVRQLQRTGIAMATVPVVDALEGRAGKELSAGWNGAEAEASSVLLRGLTEPGRGLGTGSV